MGIYASKLPVPGAMTGRFRILLGGGGGERGLVYDWVVSVCIAADSGDGLSSGGDPRDCRILQIGGVDGMMSASRISDRLGGCQKRGRRQGLSEEKAGSETFAGNR